MIDRSDFRELFCWYDQHAYRSSESSAALQLARDLGVNLRTVKTWLSTGHAPSYAVQHCLYAVTGVPAAPVWARDEWEGWKFVRRPRVDFTRPGPRGGCCLHYTAWVLESPNGSAWEAAELDTLGFKLGRLNDLERELNALRSAPVQYLLPVILPAMAA